jgi:hypothetical protein
MVRHDDEFIQTDLGTDDGRAKPFLPDNLTHRPQGNAAALNAAEQIQPMIGTNRHEVRAWPSVIKMRQLN